MVLVVMTIYENRIIASFYEEGGGRVSWVQSYTIYIWENV